MPHNLDTDISRQHDIDSPTDQEQMFQSNLGAGPSQLPMNTSTGFGNQVPLTTSLLEVEVPSFPQQSAAEMPSFPSQIVSEMPSFPSQFASEMPSYGTGLSMGFQGFYPSGVTSTYEVGGSSGADPFIEQMVQETLYSPILPPAATQDTEPSTPQHEGRYDLRQIRRSPQRWSPSGPGQGRGRGQDQGRGLGQDQGRGGGI